MSEVTLYATPPFDFVWAGPTALPQSESNARALQCQSPGSPRALSENEGEESDTRSYRAQRDQPDDLSTETAALARMMHTAIAHLIARTADKL